MDPFLARRLLASARAAIGVASLVTPRLVGRAMGVDPGTNPASPYLLRMFGARELYLAAPLLMPAPGLDERELAARAVPVDTADALAALAAGVRGYLPWRAALPGTAIAGFGAWLGTQAKRHH